MQANKSNSNDDQCETNPFYRENDKSDESSDQLSSEDESVMDFDSLPSVVKRRVNALENLHQQKVIIDHSFIIEMTKLEIEFEKKYLPIYEKRSKIINGNYEPNDDECKVEHNDQIEGKEEVIETKKDVDPIDMSSIPKGIPEFWLTIFKRDETISYCIEEYDEPILRHLTDIQVKRNVDPLIISLAFHFSPNDYFTNDVLVKQFHLSPNPDSILNDMVVNHSIGTKINWKEGKNVTESKSKKSTNTIPNSFFYFFDAPKDVEENEDLKEEMFEDDWNIGKLLIFTIVPNAVHFYTGEIYDEQTESETEDTTDDEQTDDETETEDQTTETDDETTETETDATDDENSSSPKQ